MENQPYSPDEARQEAEQAETVNTVSPDEQSMRTEISNIETTQELENEIQLHEEDEETEVLSSEDEQRYASLSREALVEKLESFLNSNQVSQMKQAVAFVKLNFIDKTKELNQQLKEKFVADGGLAEDFKPVEDFLQEKFFKITAKIKELHQKQKEEAERLKVENLKKKQAVLEQLRQLIESDENLKTTYDEFNKLKDTWREIGQIPREEINNLWQSYHFLVEKFFDKVKINKELRDLDLKKNMESKIDLCEKVEELLLEPSINKSFKLLQVYHDQWKEIGPVPMDKKDELWERFKKASDSINQKRRQYYEQMQSEQDQNLLAKQALCSKLDELMESMPESVKTWNEATDKVDELLKTWKSIGRAAHKENEEIWATFKSKLDIFFAQKKEYFDKIHDEYTQNYERKLGLAVQAEAILLRDDLKKATQELLQLQKEWKEIGPVAKKHSDKLWKRFRAACDKFFEQKAAHFEQTHAGELENLKAKEALIKAIKDTAFGENKAENLDKLKAFQRQWIEIGFVPMREKERLQQAYHQALDAQMAKIGVLPGELNASAFASKFADVNTPEDAQNLSSKDVQMLSNKIIKLKEELLTWENNLGFFSHSKNADVLRKEFENKLQKGKQELALLEAKMRIIRSK